MQKLRIALFAAALIAGIAPVKAQQFQTIPSNTVIGRLGNGVAGPSSAIPMSTFLTTLIGAQSANTVYAGPTSGGIATPTFRALVGADLPAPGASSFGGVKTLTCSSHNWFNTLSTAGSFGCSQPAFSDISGTIAATQLPNPSAATLGGVKSLTAVTHEYLTSIGTNGTPTQAQPSCGDLSDATYCNTAAGQLAATATNDNAASGKIGEDILTTVASGSAVSLTTSAAANLGSVSLTAGDWDVYCTANFSGSSSPTLLRESISTTTASENLVAGKFVANSATSNLSLSDSSPGMVWTRASIASTTSYFCVVRCTFGTGTCSVYGTIEARRRR